MKIKRLICTFAAVLGMISCSNEIPERKEGNLPLSIVLSIGKPETKAVGAEIKPSIEEVTINRYHVAIFQEGRRIAHVEYGDGIPLLTEDSRDPYNPQYKAEFEDIPHGPIEVYVIANYPLDKIFKDFNSEEKWGTYSLYQDQIVSTTSFEADKLVKIGYRRVIVDNETTRINLSLIQLVAGIDVSIEQFGENVYEEGEADKFDILDATEAELYPIIDEAEIDEYIGKNVITSTIKNYLIYKGEEFEWESSLASNGKWNHSGETWFNANNDYVYNKIAPESGSLYFRAQVMDKGNTRYNEYTTDFKIVAFARNVECEVRVPAEGLVKGLTTVRAINGKSDITIYDDKTVENKQYGKLDQSSLNTRFYTYEIGPDKSDMELEVQVGDGTIYNIYRKTYKQYGYKIYRGHWIDKTRTKYAWNGGADIGFPISAWLPVTKNNEILDHGSGIPTRIERGDGSLSNIKTYLLSIPSSSIIKGHLYQVKGKINPEVKPDIQWKVVREDQTTIDDIEFGKINE